MENDVENNDWKKEAPYMASLEGTSPFVLPEGYFDTLAARIKAQIYLSELQEVAAEPSFKVPAGYFDNLTDRIQASVAAESMRPSVAQGGFIVPEHYFQNLSGQIQAKTTKRPTGNIVKLLQSNFFKYSAAACLVLMSGILLYLTEPGTVSQKMVYMDPAATEQMLFDIDEEVIIDHIQHSEAEKASNAISDTELESYILNNFSQSDLISE